MRTGLHPSVVLEGTGITWRCLPHCDDDGDCDAGYRCFTSTLVRIEDASGRERTLGSCLPACDAGACPAEATAIGLACEPSGTYCTAPCESDAQCYPTMRCASGRCAPR